MAIINSNILTDKQIKEIKSHYKELQEASKKLNKNDKVYFYYSGALAELIMIFGKKLFKD